MTNFQIHNQQSKAFDPILAKACAELSARAYRECTVDGPLSTQLLVVDGRTLPMAPLQPFLFIAFRGSREILDFVTDADVRLHEYEVGGVHRGFDRVFRGIEEALINATKRRRHSPVVLTGHSLGGALAQMAGFHLHADAAIESVYTFGQPRVGDAAFAHTYNTAVGARTFRLVHEEDIVPRLPGALMGYRHAGQEIFLNSAGRIVMNPTLLEKLSSDARGLWRELFHHGPLGLATLLNDHSVHRYVERVSALAAINQNTLRAEQEFMTQRFSAPGHTSTPPARKELL